MFRMFLNAKKSIPSLKQSISALSDNSNTNVKHKYAEFEPNKLLFVTSNKNKASEVISIAKDKNMSNQFAIVSFSDITSNPEIQEIQDLDVKTVCIDKVKRMHAEISKIINFSETSDQKLLIVCEDTGLYLEGGYMNGFPGALVKQFCDSVGDNICKIHANRKAITKTAVCVYDGQNVNTFVGETCGTITQTPQIGPYGFGFDSCFKPEGYDKTFAQMTSEEKNEFSMRKVAFGKLFDWYSVFSHQK
jgi:non-canonical purine NTP pyrophosphatase (RdgB/HAM1 family)